MAKKIRVAILISGRGSNMIKLIEASRRDNFPAEIVVVGSNNPNALGLEYAKSQGLNIFVVDHKNFSNFNDPRLEFDRELYKNLINHQVDLVCLAGFMRILSAWFINQFPQKIINIHPSLLPNFKGAHAVKDALEARVEYSGCTTHFVVPEIDSGPIIMQRQVAIDKYDNLEILTQKILTEEHQIYPATLELVCNQMLQNL